ncbi:uncharacterized protein BXZ73DRAFT_38598 [Epithele typhae]|uniref:uncharacterized protein n=1 Tax=Epithele typhae TaxID=378194 RepID=UPI002008AB96|nr:uncharacterized protein BXZ73DRAFT_38598 [Epithele typhae]KAH9944969.1 hypothetical protein BXZ73DRAFT_38598 [Epithele typhae]
MDSTQPQAATSSSSPISAHPEEPSQPESSEPKVLRTSARVKAAKQKERQNQRPQPDSSAVSIPTPTKRSRDKGKGREVPDEARGTKRTRRSTLPATSALTINEPPKDTKGKKRAAPEDHSEDENPVATSSASKKLRRATSAYSLRPRTDSQTASDMTRKTRASSGKGKVVTKSKNAMTAASSSRVGDEDVEMVDAECVQAEGELRGEGHEEEDEDHDEDVHEGGGGDDEDDDDEADRDLAATLGGLTGEASAMSIFGDYRQFGSYMMGISGRLKTMLNNIKPTADPTTRLLTLQELSELLSISTEDTLAGSFQVEAFIRELVRILGGTGNTDEDEGDDEEAGEQDEDAALAAALAMSAGGGAYQGDENLEAQVLACRCLANLMEALPGVAHTVVYHGAIPVLCSKLIEISYIDLAEQTLSTLEKISEEFPSSIVREGGLAALLNYLDFFSIAVQRTALQAASNCCRNVSVEHFPMIRGVWPIIRSCLGYSDQRLVEFACLCVIRIIDSYYRSSPENLEQLVDRDLIQAINMLLLPAGGSPLIAPSTFTLLLRALATSARVSSKITIVLLEAGIVDTLYQILTGVLPPQSDGLNEQGDAAGGQGLGGGLADMTVMENLAHRPKDQIEEALSLVSELMPPLPKDGVFDHKAYTEKAFNKMTKAKAKADRAAARQAASSQVATSSTVPQGASTAEPSSTTPADENQGQPSADAMLVDPQSAQDAEDSLSQLPKESVTMDRTDMLRSKPEAVGRFLHLMVPILVDVYAASVIAPVRIKTLTGLLKAVSFLDGDELKRVFTFVPVASFASSILSSKDHPTLVIGALQLVELLLARVPAEYKPVFRREGVFHEIETLASRAVTSTKSKDKDKIAEKDISEAPSPADSGVTSSVAVPISVITSIPGHKKLSSLSIEPDDAITLRARVIRFKYLAVDDSAGSEDVFAMLRRLVERITDPVASEKDLSAALGELAALFGSQSSSVSSFELLQSGVIDGLLQFFSESEERTIPLPRRQELFFSNFTTRKPKGSSSQTAFAVFVKKLQESLTRMESFEVISVAQNADDSKRSSPSLLARQLRLRLMAAEDTDTPRNFSNVIVSIHAIATFQALHDYLRPRVSGVSPGARLSGMLAALAASGLTPPSSRFGFPDIAGANAESSAAASSSAGGGSVSRRRSLRLSAKKASASAGEAGSPPASASGAGGLGEASVTAPSDVAEGDSVASAAEPAPSETVVNDDEFTADFTDEEVDAEIIEDVDDEENAAVDRTINVSVGEDSKVEAQTPDGTHVPTPKAPTSSSTTPRTSTPKTSYAAALKSKPTDWHLEFFMDDHQLPLDLTVYGAIHQHELRKHRASGSPFVPAMIWQGVYSIKFKKVPGPLPDSEGRGDEIAGRSRSPAPSLSSLPEDAPHAKILRVLRVLHKLNAQESERATPMTAKRVLAESAFVNNKLSAKLTRQLEEPMIVASSCLPDWALDLPQHFPFLFPFATRYNFLQSTSFGYARLILKWQSQQQTRGQDSSRRDDGVGLLGRLQRQKVRVMRKHLLESAVKVFELYGSSSSVLEVEYFEEVGTGLGPTLEFYSLVSREFARRDLKIWRDADPTMPGAHVHHPLGLFPAPISPEDIVEQGIQKRTHILQVIGRFVAKAMLDSRIIDLSFNKIFLKLVLGEEVPRTIDSLRRVDPELAASLTKIQNIAATNSQNEKLRRKLAALEDLEVETVSIDDLGLDFTVPGYDIELKPGGRDIAVTAENVEEYIQEVIDVIIGKGAEAQAQAFREGFSKVFPISDLQAFTCDELAMLFGNADEDWSIETLSETLKADHGFNVESRAIRDLIEIMSEYDATSRRSYLQFITGSPKLPIGGFKGLNPPLTVVRKPHEAPLTANDYLPSVMTCVNYLKLPEYSSKQVMTEKLATAMREGVGSFHLS